MSFNVSVPIPCAQYLSGKFIMQNELNMAMKQIFSILFEYRFLCNKFLCFKEGASNIFTYLTSCHGLCLFVTFIWPWHLTSFFEMTLTFKVPRGSVMLIDSTLITWPWPWNSDWPWQNDLDILTVTLTLSESEVMLMLLACIWPWIKWPWNYVVLMFMYSVVIYTLLIIVSCVCENVVSTIIMHIIL